MHYSAQCPQGHGSELWMLKQAECSQDARMHPDQGWRVGQAPTIDIRPSQSRGFIFLPIIEAYAAHGFPICVDLCACSPLTLTILSWTTDDATSTELNQGCRLQLVVLAAGAV